MNLISEIVIGAALGLLFTITVELHIIMKLLSKGAQP